MSICDKCNAYYKKNTKLVTYIGWVRLSIAKWPLAKHYYIIYSGTSVRDKATVMVFSNIPTLIG